MKINLNSKAKVAVGISALLFFVINIDIKGPAYQQDEIGYLINAAFYAGHIVDGFSSYHAGYSLFLSPLFLFFEDWGYIWLGVKIINCLFWGGALYVGFLVGCLLYPLMKDWDRIKLLAISALYPSWAAMAGYAFSQSIFVFTYIYSLYLLIKLDSERKSSLLKFSLSVAFLYLIHPTGLVAMLASCVTIFFMSIRKLVGYKQMVLHAILLLMVVSVYKKIIQPWMMTQMTPLGYDARSHYPAIDYLINSMGHQKFWMDWVLINLGQVSYLVICSFGLVGAGLFGVILLWKNNSSGKNSDSNPKLLGISVYILLSLIGVVALTSVSFASQNGGPGTLDEWFYGRYAEGYLLPLLIIGFASQHQHDFSRTIFWIVVLFLTGYLLNARVNEVGPLNMVNLQSFWPMAIFSNISIGNYFYVGALALVVNSMLSKKNFVIYFLISFVSVGLLNLNWHKNILSNYSKPSDLIRIVKMNYPPSSCVAFDPALPVNFDSQMSERIRLYSFYLFNYDYRRMTVEEWANNCEGPYFSFDLKISERYPDARIVAFESSGLALYAMKRDKTKFPNADDVRYQPVTVVRNTDQLCVRPWSCISLPANRLNFNKKSTEVSKNGLKTKGVSGFLFYGPYSKLLSGDYEIVITGEFKKIEDSLLDVVSDRGEVSHGSWLLKELISKDNNQIKVKFNLSKDVADIEFRISVSDNSDIEVRDLLVVPSILHGI